MLLIYNNTIIDAYKYKTNGKTAIIEYKIRDGYSHIEVPQDKVKELESINDLKK